MATSDLIAQFIMNAIDDNSDGFAELRRSSLAEMFSCVPSQINYVISTRFSPERGYIVESRRGGGGYIRITRVRRSPKELVMHTVNSVGDSLDMSTAAAFVSNIYESGIISKKEAGLIMTAIGNNALRPVSPAGRDVVRASIFKHLLVHLISE